MKSFLWFALMVVQWNADTRRPISFGEAILIAL
ncbi:hypothetical protein HDF08_003763 [Edaphobacter lichenicola]|uniref:Uncharacterized protein n=1 Tax=Tunturiibacter lichenicola TaxID=2051959 RepID=A0A852VMK7_9BACT|nr:hypothetical protein [Edaphobacter lichenicola]